MWFCELEICSSTLGRGPSFRDMDSHATLRPLGLGIVISTLGCIPSSWGYGLPCLVWPLELGSVSPTLGATAKGGVHIPNSKGHTKAWESIYPTLGHRGGGDYNRS